MIPKLGPLEIIVILVVVLLIFGPKNLPKLGSAIGKSVKNLREGLDSGKKDKKDVEKVAAEQEKAADVVEEAAEVVEETPVDATEAPVVDKPKPKSTVEE